MCKYSISDRSNNISEMEAPNKERFLEGRSLSVQWNWTEVCGAGGFQIWDADRKDLGLCFSILVIQIPLLALFSAVSAYYFGKPSARVVRTKGQLCIIWIRSLVVLLMAILPIVQISLLTIESKKLAGNLFTKSHQNYY
jgi:hypothetical protein